MGRLSLVLAFVLMLSALSLVTARFQSRQLYVVSDRLENLAGQLDTDWRRLQLERAELARHSRIDDVARNELNMVSGSPERTLYFQNTVRDNDQKATHATPAPGGQP